MLVHNKSKINFKTKAGIIKAESFLEIEDNLAKKLIKNYPASLQKAGDIKDDKKNDLEKENQKLKKELEKLKKSLSKKKDDQATADQEPQAKAEDAANTDAEVEEKK